MTPASRSYDPRSTVAERWWRELTDSVRSSKPHWQTKVAYYTAVADLIARDPDEPLRWRAVVDEVRPQGSASTFYEVTGRHAKHALIGAYESQEDPEALQIALTYRRLSAVEQLVDEAKVWSFWPFREAYFSHSCGPDWDIEGYLATVAGWADATPALASALDCAPPACAVEDLVVLQRGALATLRAQRQLRAVLHHVVSSRPLTLTPATRRQSLHSIIERSQAVEVDHA